MHKTVFHSNTGDILFVPQWILHGKKETYLTCLVLVVIGIAYQGIKFARQQYGRKCRNLNCKRYILNKGHLLQTLMYILQFVVGYALMLSVMTYNLWILVAVLVGFGLGYFFFGWGEYEEPSAHLLSQNQSYRSYIQTCREVTASSSTTQELLAYSKAEQAESLGDNMAMSNNINGNSSGNNIRCGCSTKV